MLLISSEVIKIDVSFLEKAKYNSVTDYCRYLMEHWDIPCPYLPSTRIEVYRGEMLCLTVSSIEEGSKLRPDPRGGFKRVYSPVERFKSKKGMETPERC